MHLVDVFIQNDLNYIVFKPYIIILLSIINALQGNLSLVSTML